MSTCPVCEDELIVFELGGVEVDHCLECGGTWLDAGELEMIVELAGVEGGDFSAALERARSGERSSRRCPRCTRRLRLVHVGADPAVALDRCAKGHGLWFDRGEMKRVIENFQGGEGGAIARFFAELYRGELEEVQQPLHKGQEP